MTTAYTPILQLALPVTGELNGTWGDVVNNNITSMVEQAIAGLATINTWTTASHTLTTANGTTDEARCAILECSGAPGAAATVICPAFSKVYIIKNSVTGGYAVTLKTSAGTGISVPNGSTALLYCDGTNVVSGATYMATIVATSITDTGLTSGRVTYAGTGGLLQDAAAFTFDGTILSATRFAGALNGTVGATTANTGAFTTVSATGVITSTLVTGTAPFTVASTTNVANLNASSLNGATFASPGAIGSTTAGTGAFTTLAASSTVSGTGFTSYFASPPALGTTAPAEVKATTGWAANLALTDAATVAWNTATSQVATFTFVSTNRTMGAPTNLKDGAFYALAVIQNGGSNTLTWNSVFKWAAGTAPTLSTAAGAKDYFTFRSDGVSLFQQGISQAVA
jgi:hypothetical protein